MHEAHSLSAASGRSLQHDGIADARRNLLALFQRFEATRGSRDEGNAGALHRLAGLRFRAHRVHRSGGGADELHPGFDTGLGKLRILGKKSVTGMDRVRSRARRDVENLLDIQVRLGCRRRRRCGYVSSALRTCSEARSTSE